jgi:hypothetical protein
LDLDGALTLIFGCFTKLLGNASIGVLKSSTGAPSGGDEKIPLKQLTGKEKAYSP